MGFKETIATYMENEWGFASGEAKTVAREIHEMWTEYVTTTLTHIKGPEDIW